MEIIIFEVMKASGHDLDILRAFDKHPDYIVESKHIHEWKPGCTYTIGWKYRVIKKGN